MGVGGEKGERGPLGGGSRSTHAVYRWVLSILLLAFTLWVFRRFATLQQLGAALSRAEWSWLVVAAALHLGYFLPYALLYEYGFAAVGVRSRLSGLIPLVFASIFANAVLPAGDAPAAALFIDDAERRGQSGARAAVGMVLVLLADLATLFPFLAYGLIALAQRHDLKFYVLLGAAIFTAYVTVLSALVGLSAWKPDWVRRLFAWVQRMVNRVGGWFQHPDLLKDDWARKNADQFSDAAQQLGRHKGELAWMLVYGLLTDAISAAALYACFLAFRQPIALGPLLAGFSIGEVFWVLDITPQGVAAEEGMMMLVFTSLGIPSPTAAAVTLVYRLVSYWLPLVLGFFCFLGMGKHIGGRPEQDAGGHPAPQKEASQS